MKKILIPEPTGNIEKEVIHYLGAFNTKFKIIGAIRREENASLTTIAEFIRRKKEKFTKTQ